MSARAFRNKPTTGNTIYPRMMGRRGAIATHHHLSADAGAEMLKAGGNAVDAVVAAVLVEGLVNPQMYTLGGECPMLIRMASEGRVRSINGNTMAPATATPDAYRSRGLNDVPDEGILASGVPAAFGALMTALGKYGKLTFDVVAAPALAHARDGFPVHRGLKHQENYGLDALAPKFIEKWPESAALYLSKGSSPALGATFKNAAFADLLEYLIGLSKKHQGRRSAKTWAALDGFYKGDVASAIDGFSRRNDGLIRRSDVESFKTIIEDPVSFNFYGATLYKCGFWNQGPVVLQTLAILRHAGIDVLAHNSADYVHIVVEAMKLAFADREQYYGDPSQVDVPAEALLSEDYGQLRAALIDLASSEGSLIPGDPRRMRAELPAAERLGGASWGDGTVHVNAVDAEGNMVAATPSGAWIKSGEVVPELGFPLGNRLMTFYLEPGHHPNVVAPFKRPRTTISPSLAEKDGKSWMVFGSMGGDQQDQWMLQYFLNRALFGMSLQEAIEAPKFSSEHFPGFFAPHDRSPRRIRAEPALGDAVISDLQGRGHEVEMAPEWSEGFLLATGFENGGAVLEAGCDPRCAKTDIFAAAARCW